eukprot:2571820-Lingulodinium_polyedra.AAC.1
MRTSFSYLSAGRSRSPDGTTHRSRSGGYSGNAANEALGTRKHFRFAMVWRLMRARHVRNVSAERRVASGPPARRRAT